MNADTKVDMPLVILFGGPGRSRVIHRLLQSGEAIAAVVVPEPHDPRLAEEIRALRDANVRVERCPRDRLDAVVGGFEGHFLLSLGFPYLLKASLLRRFPMCLNVHPTLLPKYRGPTSGAYILINGERRSGVTVHVIDEGMDTGAIVAQAEVPLSRFDTIRSLQRKVYEREPDVVLEAMARVRTTGFRPAAQDETQATTYPSKRKPDDSQVDPSKSLLELFDSIRACDPDRYPAFFLVDGQKVCIRLWRPNRPAEDGDDML